MNRSQEPGALPGASRYRDGFLKWRHQVRSSQCRKITIFKLASRSSTAPQAEEKVLLIAAASRTRTCALVGLASGVRPLTAIFTDAQKKYDVSIAKGSLELTDARPDQHMAPLITHQKGACVSAWTWKVVRTMHSSISASGQAAQQGKRSATVRLGAVQASAAVTLQALPQRPDFQGGWQS